MAAIFCPSARRLKLENRQVMVSAVLATLNQVSTAEKKPASPEEYYAIFATHYTGDTSELPKKRLGKALRMLDESKRRDSFTKKLEKKNSTLERKLSTSSSTVKSSGSSETTLVDSSDEEGEKVGKKSTDSSDGAPLELTWTWSALGEAF